MPGDLASLADESGGQVLVVASTPSAPSDWQREAAVSLARAWARRVGRFFLVDLSLEEPCLHDPLEMDNQEGISDVVLYGSAVQRVAQPADDGSFFFASVGTPTSDVEAVLTHERWDGLLEGFGRASATLCAYLPTDLPGAESMLQRAHRIVVLGDGASDLALEAARDRVAAVLAPPETEESVDVDVVDIEELAPEAEEAAAPGDERAEVEVVDIGELAPEPEAGVVDIGELAPEPPEPEVEVVDIGDLAPDEVEEVPEEEPPPEEEPSPVAATADGEAQEEAAEEPAGEPGPREEALEESVSFGREMETDADLDLDDAAEAGDELRETAEVVDIGALAPASDAEAPVEAEEEAGAVDVDELAPEAAEPEAEVVDVGELAPEEPEEVIEEEPEEDAPDRVAPDEGTGEEEAAFEPGPTEEALEDSVSFDPETEVEADLDLEEEDVEGPAEAVDGRPEARGEDGWGEEVMGDDVAAEPAGDDDTPLSEDADLERGADAEAVDVEEEEEFQGFGGFGGLEETDEDEPAEDVPAMEVPTTEEPAMEEPEEGAPDEASASMEDDDHPEEADDDLGSLSGEDEDAQEDFGAFDMGSFDTLGGEDEEAEDVASSDDEVRIRSDFGEGDDEVDTPPDVSDTEFEDDEAGMATFGEDVGGPAAEEAEEGDDDESFDFGDFSGEMDTVEEEEELQDDDVPDDVSAGDDAALDEDDAFGEEDPFGAEDAGEGGGFGDDLVTGPDFGQGAPDDDWSEEGEDEDEDDDIQHPGEAEVPEEVPEELDPSGPVPDEEERKEEDAPEDDAGEAPVREDGTARRWLGPLIRVVVLLVVAAGAAAGAHWFDLVRIPGFDRVLVRTLGPMAVATTPEVQVGDPVPETPVLDYSLTMDAYRSLDAAAEVARAWEESFDGYVFAVAPVQVEGDAFYRLLAGPATTSEEAEALRSSLSELLTREDPSAWVVRSTPLAFLLSEHESAEAARGEARRLRGEGVPGYVLEVVYPGDTVRYRVYSGAFESGQEARLLQGILTEHGHDGARFTQRRGRLPE